MATLGRDLLQVGAAGGKGVLAGIDTERCVLRKGNSRGRIANPALDGPCSCRGGDHERRGRTVRFVATMLGGSKAVDGQAVADSHGRASILSQDLGSLTRPPTRIHGTGEDRDKNVADACGVDGVSDLEKSADVFTDQYGVPAAMAIENIQCLALGDVLAQSASTQITSFRIPQRVLLLPIVVEGVPELLVLRQQLLSGGAVEKDGPIGRAVVDTRSGADACNRTRADQ